MKPTESTSSGFQFLIRTLHSRNYRLFFAGQGISLVGTWMQNVALSWLVYRMTHSAFLLGVVGFAGQIPTFFITPFAGVFVDRHNRHRLLLITQTLAMIQALVLAFLVLTNNIQIWQIIALSIFLGMINSLDIPCRHAFVFELVEKREDLGNAIALNSSMFNAARLIGPSVAGMLILVVGEGMCFLINGLSFIAVIIALYAIKVAPREVKKSGAAVWEELKQGVVYAFGFAPIRAILMLLALMSLMGISYAILMPVFATKVLHGSALTLGFLMSAAGFGALIGAIYLAWRKSVVGLNQIIVYASFVFGVGLIAFALSRTLWLSLFMLVLTGFGFMVQSAASNTILQTIVDDDKRGRVMSLFAMSFMGMVPFGSLIAGVLASRFGAPNTLIIGGLTCMIGALLFARQLNSIKKLIRPIYVKKGIITEVAMGIQQTDLK